MTERKCIYLTNFLIIAFTSICSNSLWAQDSNISVCTAYKTHDTINVDGVLNEPAWKNTRSIGKFYLNSDSTKLATYQTDVKVLWDNDNLYLSFRAESPYIWSTKTVHDEWGEESIEALIDPTSRLKHEYEFLLNPLGTFCDLHWATDDLKESLAWNSEGSKTAVHVTGKVKNQVGVPLDGKPEDTEWAAEMAIPFLNFKTAPHIPPQNGDKWRINFYRVEQQSSFFEQSAWSPTLNPSFHYQKRFGEIIFLEKPVKTNLIKHKSDKSSNKF